MNELAGRELKVTEMVIDLFHESVFLHLIIKVNFKFLCALEVLSVG